MWRRRLDLNVEGEGVWPPFGSSERNALEALALASSRRIGTKPPLAVPTPGEPIENPWAKGPSIDDMWREAAARDVGPKDEDDSGEGS